ncbi:MAG: hypothetical protein NVS2B17_02050 [Candidatus Velthaea sp.]
MVAMLFMLAIADFGRALYTYHLVSNAAREATRYAIVRGSSCTTSGCPAGTADIQSYIRGISPGVDITQLNVSATWSPNPGNGCTASPYQGPGCLVTVQVAYTFSFLTSMLPNVSMPMVSISQMYISQ